MDGARPTSDNRKFHPPRALRNQIERTRLLDWIVRGEDVPLTVLLAPAGYGKSTLLRQAAAAFAAEGKSVAWLNCDASDREAENFIFNIREALAVCSPAFADCRPTITAITETMERSESDLVIVIDDYEKLRDSNADSIIEVFTALLPPRRRILIGARKFDEAKIAKLMIEGLARRIDASVLSFDADETDELLRPLCDAGTISRVFEVSEGWPMMVQLARIKADQPDGGPPLWQTLLRPHSELFGFLAKEVFASLPEPQAELLTACSIVNYIDKDIAHALTDNDKAEALLAAATVLDPLVSTQSDATFTIKLHPVMREFLLQALSQKGARSVANLHSRAARHYAKAGDIFHAIQHALSADDAALAAGIFEETGGPLAILNHGPANVWSYLNQMPRPVVDRSPSLSATRLIRHVVHGDGLAAQQELEKFKFDSAAETSDDRLSVAELGQLAKLAASLLLDARAPINAYLEEDLPRLEVLMRRKSRRDSRILALFLPLKFFLEYRYGSMEAARKMVDEYEAICNNFEYSRQLPSISPHFGMLAFAAADFNLTAHYLSENLAHHWDGFVGREEQLLKVGNSLLAKMYYEQDRIDDALANIHAVGDIDEPNFSELIEALDVTTARCYAQRGELQRALDHLDKARSRRKLYGLDNVIPAIDATLTSLLVQSGDFEQARAIFNERGLAARWRSEQSFRYWNWIFAESYLRAFASVSFAEGDYGSVIELAGVVREKARCFSRDWTTALVDVIAASAHAGLGAFDEAQAMLRSALAVHAPCGVIRPYFDTAPNTAPLLEEIRDSDVGETTRAHIDSILRLWNANIKSAALQKILTPRESDVLVELAKGRPTKLIARHLGVSPETVKHHLKNIFAKLGAENRKDAVSEAYRRALGSIDVQGAAD